MDMRSVDPALELRPKAFKAVHRCAACADIFARPVVDRHVTMAAQSKPVVALEFVGMDLSAGKDVRIDRRLERGSADIFDNLRNHVAVALHHAENDRLTWGTAPAFASLADPADIGFVNLHYRPETAYRIAAVNSGHILADFMAHAPSGFVGNAELALDFLGREAVTARREQEHDEEPVAQRRARALKRRSSHRRNLMAAILTRIDLACPHPVKVSVPTALGAVVAVAKANAHQVIEAGVLIRELSLKLAKSGRFAAHAHCVAGSLT